MIWCVTFPLYHPLCDCWIEIIAADIRTAREAVYTMFGPRYGAIYEPEQIREKFAYLFPGGRVGKTINALDIPGGP
jgi:hypothetical protein